MKQSLRRPVYRNSCFFVVAVVICCSSLLRAAGLPGEYLLTQRWRELFGAHSPSTNPAFLTDENYLTVRGAFCPTLQGAYRLWETGLTLPLGLYQSLGLSWLGEDGGEVKKYEMQGDGLIRPTDETVNNLNSFLMLTWAINPLGRLSAGLNLNFASQSNFGDPLMGVGLDLGCTYRLLHHPVAGYHVLGLAFTNVLTPSMTSTIEVTAENSAAYARNLTFSWMGEFFEKRIDAGVDVDIKDILAQAGSFKKPDPGNPAAYLDESSAVEYEASARLGVWLMRIFRAYAQFGGGNNEQRHLGLAGGVNIPAVNAGRDLEVLYQFNSMLKERGISTHTIYMRAELGQHREQAYARRVAFYLDASPNDLYNRALKLYHQQEYWDAFFVFGQILALFPDFFKNDWVKYYLHSCQEMLDMRTAALKGYTETVEAYPRSEVKPYADLGLMRVAYRQHLHLDVERQFSKLTGLEVPDSLKYHACYLMGETHQRTNNPSRAIQMFAIVPPTHPAYIASQHSMAVAYVLNDNPFKAKELLQAAIEAVATTPAQKELINRSFLFLGYLFYEEQALSKAVLALRKVPVTSYYYEDALLGLGWTAVRAEQWEDCLTAARELRRISHRRVLRAEAGLLEGYALIRNKQYIAARQILQRSLDEVRELRPPSSDSLALYKQKYRNDRIQYNFVAEAAFDLSQTQHSELGLRRIDSLHVKQKMVRAKIDNFLYYNDEFVRRSFFARNIEETRNDIEYALTVMVQMTLRKEQKKTMKRESEKQQELDEEIRRIQEQMEDLEEGSGADE